MARIEDVEEALFAIVSVLNAGSIPYAVMGGLAFRVYALPRGTQDVDVTIAIDEQRLPELRDKLYEKGCEVPPVYESGWLDRLEGMPLFKVRYYVGDQPIDIDIFVSESAFQESIVNRRTFHEIDGKEIALVSPEDLILLKVIAGRARDLLDIQELLIAVGTLDQSYMYHWADELGVRSQLDTALEGVDL